MSVNIRPKNKATVAADTGLSGSRYCISCHVRLVQNPTNTPFDKDIYQCPNCGVRFGIKETEPSEKLRTTFAGISANPDNKYVYQSTIESMSRKDYFIAKRAVDRRTEEGIKDPYLQQLRKKQGIKITNVEYHSQDDY